MTTMQEMESVVTKKVGNIVAYCRNGKGKMGLILKKIKKGTKVLYTGRMLEADEIDCEYRIMQIRNGRLSKKRWESSCPYPIGFLPPEEVKSLLGGDIVNRGCKQRV